MAAIPLSQRRGDLLILGFFWLNLLFITYQMDLEQLVIADPSDFDYPIWPLPPVVDLIHWWGHTFDPVLLARPAWWRMTIWIDALFFGPYYVFAIYAFTKGKDWIRFPSIVYGSVMITNVTIILGEEIAGQHATPELGMVLFANAPWLLVPIFLLYQMWKRPHPFTRDASTVAS
jgi:hypothetical protein